MKNIKIIIGANFGDEGKGLMVDYFSSKYKDGIVVRFNGGSQAGHTVVTPESVRHVFSHFGSGTLVGLPTYLSEDFIVNPMTFRKEYEGLSKKGIVPKIFINRNCLVTTPYDVMLNQIIESYRQENKHGSCGLGINETIIRNKNIKIEYCDLYNDDILLNKLLYMKNHYFNQRLNELNIKTIPIEYINLLFNDNIIMNYFEDIKFLLNNSITSTGAMLKNYDNIIFEGAQGLLLDKNSSYFPHVTNSDTGIKNAIDIIKKINYEKENIEIIYVTRNYMTRHGTGLFFTEIKGKPYYNIIDLTNIYNEYQGNIRYGLLDLNLLSQTIKFDLFYARNLTYKCKIAITCLDQVDYRIKYFDESNCMITSDKADFLKDIFKILKKENHITSGYLSYGMTRNTIEEYKYNE